MNRRGMGFGTRYDKFSVNKSYDEQAKPEVNFNFPLVPNSKRRFCESCRTYVFVDVQPKKKFKGWKCNKCKGVDE